MRTKNISKYRLTFLDGSHGVCLYLYDNKGTLLFEQTGWQDDKQAEEYARSFIMGYEERQKMILDRKYNNENTMRKM